MQRFEVFRLREVGAKVSAGFELATIDELDPGDVVIAVACSSINYKDALAATGRGKIIRRFPCIGGIDLAGTVVETRDRRFSIGDRVIATGYGIGVTHDGGYSRYARLPSEWVLPMPPTITPFEAMALGTAGFTAGLAVARMELEGLSPDKGPVAVTGATGGVGSIAVSILAQKGYEVTAISGKTDATGYLASLGASRVVPRPGIGIEGLRPLATETWGAAIDNLGGETLAWLLSSMKVGAPVASIGLASRMELNTSVAPFILRGISLLGVDSVNCPMPMREKVWERLATDMYPARLRDFTRSVPFEALPSAFDDFIESRVKGRVVVEMVGT